uniref:Secreted protein n=1 Tax=Globodera rostochiensis TaxID=31243 RepID=A0A914H6Q9_GLORO
MMTVFPACCATTTCGNTSATPRTAPFAAKTPLMAKPSGRGPQRYRTVLTLWPRCFFRTCVPSDRSS